MYVTYIFFSTQGSAGQFPSQVTQKKILSQDADNVLKRIQVHTSTSFMELRFLDQKYSETYTTKI